MAHVRLNRGYTSYFDPITRVHLTLANPESGVPDHYNLTGLRRAHEKGVVVLVESKPEVQPGPGDKQEEAAAGALDAQPAQELGQEEADAPGSQEAQAHDEADAGVGDEPAVSPADDAMTLELDGDSQAQIEPQAAKSSNKRGRRRKT